MSAAVNRATNETMGAAAPLSGARLEVAGSPIEGVGVRIETLAVAWRLAVRCAADVREALGAALGVPLGERIGSITRQDGREALALGPDEWWIAPDADAPDVPDAPAPPPSDARPASSVVAIGDRDMTLRLTGPAVLETLAYGCPLDLADLADNTATRTVFDGIAVTLARRSASDVDMIVTRSMAPHVRAILTHTVAERDAEADLTP